MKKLFYALCGCMALAATEVNAQIGVNTEKPEVTLHVKAKGEETGGYVGLTPEGIIAPRVSLNALNVAQATASPSQYGAGQDGAIVYVSDITGGTPWEQTENIKSTGYYYFDASASSGEGRWMAMGGNGTGTAQASWFYMPSIPISLDIYDSHYDQQTNKFGYDLYMAYSQQFNSPAAKNASAAALPVTNGSNLDFFVTYYDADVFEDVNISDAGILSYSLKNGGSATEKTFMNIIFKVK